ncbi:hypothetical protein ABEF92_006483 [Exophiala dermatitidis]|uniref:Ubiquitin-conjugating enzyme E2 O n=1 Tax=Exophiala dermatitidis (strain ATCC 34100 / CBS 525.76 / NIH/UT8656) TaxID=858893 RepID=H6BQ94_EXODN|nr:ubiquitin-conjugating enzyme E2 O [Exophiala dermatitidis NIH/UT8656]EHY53764.1 ubiquitin-conjugating enzyme E2 O [Exophiala dermatitidis NIH/UT8656]
MRSLEINDNVAVKANPSLYGTVTRTNTVSHEPLEDELIIAHTDVPPAILHEFVQTGMPPRGYVFVEFSDEAAGSSLVSEDDLVLLSRLFQIGDPVKREGSSMTGTVTNISESYILEPITTKPDFAKSCLGFNPSVMGTCTAECESRLPSQFSHPNPHTLIYDVPSWEVQRAQDLVQDDYVIMSGWLGIVDEVEYDVVVVLANGSVVVVTGMEHLHIPVPDYGKPLVALPEPDGFIIPDILASRQSWSNTIPVQRPRPGTFVIVDNNSLRRGPWLKGSYTPTTPAHGYVLDVRAGNSFVAWVESDPALGVAQAYHGPPSPSPVLHIYEPNSNFLEHGGLRLKENVHIYDKGLMPSNSERREIRGPQPGAYPSLGHAGEICTGQDHAVGAHVIFRDPIGAAEKYKGSKETRHGQFNHSSLYVQGGWDVNEFKVVFINQQASVLWQDGSTTTTDSTQLEEYGLFESELAPTDIVLKREGLRQRPVGAGRKEVSGFNEMAFFERPHDLLPKSVGIVQSVDPDERLARVRWYKEPKIELHSSGQILDPESKFGPIGDIIEDVSLYEIMSFPTLQRRRNDMCIVALHLMTPAHKSESTTLNSADARSPKASRHDSGRSGERIANSASIPSTTSNVGQAKSLGEQTATDWVGQVVAIGLDGTTTVRLGAAQPCRDLRVDYDAITTIISDQEADGDADEDIMDVDSLGSTYDFYSDGSMEAIEERVEYEGGRRLDNDSGDDNWVSDEDMNEDEDQSQEFTDAQEEGQTGNTDMANPEEDGKDAPKARSSQPSILHLYAALPSEEPPAFNVLEREPPPDQFGLHSISTAGKFLKRIMREHQILATSLPAGEIYVRTYESRLDLLRCLIIGPRDTPYENAPFLIDLYLPAGFPAEPPTAHFHSWTSGLGRINPNLYEEGKICLSLLGTWAGKHESESWSEKATILQLLVSLQGLVFVKRPFYNEAGFEGYEQDKRYLRESEQYSEKAFVMARSFVKYAILQPPGGLEDILAGRYLPHDLAAPQNSLLWTVIERARQLLEKSDQARHAYYDGLLDSAGSTDDDNRVFLRPLSLGACVMLKRTLAELQEQLDQLLHSAPAANNSAEKESASAQQ